MSTTLVLGGGLAFLLLLNFPSAFHLFRDGYRMLKTKIGGAKSMPYDVQHFSAALGAIIRLGQKKGSRMRQLFDQFSDLVKQLPTTNVDDTDVTFKSNLDDACQLAEDSVKLLKEFQDGEWDLKESIKCKDIAIDRATTEIAQTLKKLQFYQQSIWKRCQEFQEKVKGISSEIDRISERCHKSSVAGSMLGIFRPVNPSTVHPLVCIKLKVQELSKCQVDIFCPTTDSAAGKVDFLSKEVCSILSDMLIVYRNMHVMEYYRTNGTVDQFLQNSRALAVMKVGHYKLAHRYANIKCDCASIAEQLKRFRGMSTHVRNLMEHTEYKASSIPKPKDCKKTLNLMIEYLTKQSPISLEKFLDQHKVLHNKYRSFWKALNCLRANIEKLRGAVESHNSLPVNSANGSPICDVSDGIFGKIKLCLKRWMFGEEPRQSHVQMEVRSTMCEIGQQVNTCLDSARELEADVNKVCEEIRFILDVFQTLQAQH